VLGGVPLSPQPRRSVTTTVNDHDHETAFVRGLDRHGILEIGVSN
jgi:hypothetical protein